MKLKIEKMIIDSEVQYVINIGYKDMLSFLQTNVGAKLIRSAEIGFYSEASLLEVRGFLIKLVKDDLGFTYLAAIKQEQDNNSQLENLIQEFLPELEITVD